MIVSFTIAGKVEPKGRARHTIVRGKTRSFVSSYTPSETRNWESVVRDRCEQAMKGRQFSGPVKATMIFSMPRPKERQREYFCTTKPDLDNLVKSILDACNAIAWKDDSIVAELAVKKCLENDVNPAGVTVWLEDAEVAEGWTLLLEERDAAKQQRKDAEKASRQAARDAAKEAKALARACAKEEKALQRKARA